MQKILRETLIFFKSVLISLIMIISVLFPIDRAK